MKRISPWLCAAFVLSPVSCTNEIGIDTLSEISGMQVGTIAARWAEEPESRTEIQSDGTTVMWNGEEHIKLFFRPGSTSEFVSTQSGKRKDALFAGIKPTWWHIGEDDGFWYPEMWALYPYDKNAGCDGESITFTLPSKQPAKSGSFADNLFPAIGKSPAWDQPIVFYNVCGGACFSVSEEGITSVIFKSADGEALCGKVRTGFDEEGRPQICEILEGVDSVVVDTPSGFIPGNRYYAVFLPQTLQHGLRIRVRKGKMMAVTEIDRSITVNRSRFGRLDELDKGLDYVEDPNAHDPEDIIPFEDPWVEKDCVDVFDFNGDGKLSYDEAATALSIKGVLTHSDVYTSFDELRYFTRIKTIPSFSFSSCRNLKRISLPDGVTSIGDGAFRGCSNLERIALGENLSSIGYAAFSECYSLKHVHIASLQSWLGISVDVDSHINPNDPRSPYVYDYSGYPFYVSGEGHLYKDGKELTFIAIPSNRSSLRSYAFLNCNNITGVHFPSGFKSWGSAFTGCENLKTVESPSLEDWLMIDRSIHTTYYHSWGSPWFMHDGVFGDGGRLILGGEEVTHLVIPEGITEIPPAAFMGCSGIREVTLPRSLVKINKNAFFMCYQLTRVNLGTIDTWLGLGFPVCYVKYFSSNPDQTHTSEFASSASPFESSGEGHLFVGGEEITTISLPADCTDIQPGAFKNCTAITDITLPEGLRTVGTNAFYGCPNLTRVHVPSPQTWLNLSFSDNKESKGHNYLLGGFFSSSQEGHILLPYDEEVKTIVIPERTTSIGNHAFAYCTGLESITVESTVPPTLGTNVFLGVTCPIYVWTPCLPVYQAAAGWKDYQHLLTANPNTP